MFPHGVHICIFFYRKSGHLYVILPLPLFPFSIFSLSLVFILFVFCFVFLYFLGCVGFLSLIYNFCHVLKIVTPYFFKYFSHVYFYKHLSFCTLLFIFLGHNTPTYIRPLKVIFPTR